MCVKPGLIPPLGMVLGDLDATLLASDTMFIAKGAILLYSIPTELPVAAGEGVHAVQWMPCQGQRLTSIASFPLCRRDLPDARSGDVRQSE